MQKFNKGYGVRGGDDDMPWIQSIRNRSQTMRDLIVGKSGQGMTEYIFVVVLVAIACIVGVRVFGTTVREKFDGAQVTIQDQLDVEAR